MELKDLSQIIIYPNTVGCSSFDDSIKKKPSLYLSLTPLKYPCLFRNKEKIEVFEIPLPNVSSYHYDIKRKLLFLGTSLGSINVYHFIESEKNDKTDPNYIYKNKRQHNQLKKLIGNDDYSFIFMEILKFHDFEITCIKIHETYPILIVTDASGVLSLIDLNKFSLIRIFRSYHLKNKEIFEKIIVDSPLSQNLFKPSAFKYNEKKEIMKEIQSSINGDILLVSKSYFSLFSVNGVLLSIEMKKNDKITSSAIIDVK